MPNFDYLLEDYSEANWDRFVQCFEWQKCPTGIVDDDIWTALKFLVTPEDTIVMKWLQDRIPALGGQIPVKVLQLPDGGKILRALLMRMPC